MKRSIKIVCALLTLSMGISLVGCKSADVNGISSSEAARPGVTISGSSVTVTSVGNFGSTDIPIVPKSFEITSQRWYVVPRAFSNTQNSYQVHFVIQGVTNGVSVNIETLGDTEIPTIPVVNGEFSTDQIVGYYIGSSPVFLYKNRAKVVVNFSDGTQENLTYTSGAMQVIIN